MFGDCKQRGEFRFEVPSHEKNGVYCEGHLSSRLRLGLQKDGILEGVSIKITAL